MFFKVIEYQENYSKQRNQAYLVRSDWNDYNYYTTFILSYFDANGIKHEIGGLCIGQFGMERASFLGKASRTEMPNDFDSLGFNYFSLGTSVEYYANLNKLGEEIRNKILLRLKDIALDENLYKKAIKEHVTQVSLLRNIDPKTVTVQYRRIANGGAELTDYAFRFTSASLKNAPPPLELFFSVEPISFPPTNIHVLIGRNGIGKTYLLKNIERAILEPESSDRYGTIKHEGDSTFVNLVSVSFSAFDKRENLQERKNNFEELQHHFIGLVGENSTKSIDSLSDDFFNSLSACRTPEKKKLWQNAIGILEYDAVFKTFDISRLINFKFQRSKYRIKSTFNELSSGHKIVLLTITRLVETVAEKSLVIMDEPEAHLHPPLLSAFTRALSELLIQKNGVAIIATHSPVVLQEVPKSCIWKLRRNGNFAQAERLEIESFGENVGTLTREVFGLEVTESGFHKMLVDAVNEKGNYEEVIEHFGGQLGMEGRAIVRLLFHQKDGE